MKTHVLDWALKKAYFTYFRLILGSAFPQLSQLGNSRAPNDCCGIFLPKYKTSVPCSCSLCKSQTLHHTKATIFAFSRTKQ